MSLILHYEMTILAHDFKKFHRFSMSGILILIYISMCPYIDSTKALILQTHAIGNQLENPHEESIPKCMDTVRTFQNTKYDYAC